MNRGVYVLFSDSNYIFYDSLELLPMLMGAVSNDPQKSQTHATKYTVEQHVLVCNNDGFCLTVPHQWMVMQKMSCKTPTNNSLNTYCNSLRSRVCTALLRSPDLPASSRTSLLREASRVVPGHP